MANVLIIFGIMRFNRQSPARSTATATTLADDFDSLIEHAAYCLTLSSMCEVDEQKATELYQQAIDCMIEAAHAPFFGGTKTTVSYEGLDIVRDLVFERVRCKLIMRGYPI